MAGEDARRTHAGTAALRLRSLCYGFVLFATASCSLLGFAFAGQPSRLSLQGSPGGTHMPCSESKLQGQLDQARRQRRKNLIEGWRTDVAVGQAEIRVVQKIEELSAELKLLALGYANVLER